MDAAALGQLLDDVRAGRIAADDAVTALRRLPFADLGFARVDHHRALRQGRAETVYGPGKTPAQCAAIIGELLGPRSGGNGHGPAPGPPVLLSRADGDQVAHALAAHPGGAAHHHGRGPDRYATVVWRPAPRRGDHVVVVTAGTADLPVADECATTLAAHGVEPERVTDVGVAGLHRVLAVADRLAGADAVVVVAGMEGALASVIGGLTGAPVVAVPTSTGYGASLEGVTALLGMLAACASGLTVVGIDNGFGAAAAVLRLLPATPAGAPCGTGS